MEEQIQKTSVQIAETQDANDPDTVDLFDRYAQVRDALRIKDQIKIPLRFMTRMSVVSLSEVTISASDQKDSLTIVGDGTVLGDRAKIMIAADWDENDPNDESPVIEVGFKWANIDLATLNPEWTGLGDDVRIVMSEAWVVFTNEPHVIETVKLPFAAAGFYKLGPPRPIGAKPDPDGNDGRFDLVAGANLRGVIDLRGTDSLRKAFATAGLKTNGFYVKGLLGSSAGTLFGTATFEELAVLHLGVRIPTEGEKPPAWLPERNLEATFKLVPDDSGDGHNPVLELLDELRVVVGEASNRFKRGYRFNPADFPEGKAEFPLTFELDDPLELPFGISLTDVTFELTVGVDLSDPNLISSFDGSFSAKLPVSETRSIGVSIGLTIDDLNNVLATYTVTNDVSLGELLHAIAIAVGEPGGFDTTGYGDLTVDEVVFTAGRALGESSIALSASLGAWPNVFGLEWLDLTDLTVGIKLDSGIGGLDPTLTGTLASAFDIGGESAELTVEVTAGPTGVASRIRANLAEGEIVEMDDVVAFMVEEFGAAPLLGDALNDMDLDALSMFVGFDTAGNATFDVLAGVQARLPDGEPLFAATLYLKVENVPGETPPVRFFAGLRPREEVALKEIVAVPGLENVKLPNLGLILTTAEIEEEAALLTEEGYEFFKILYGCSPTAKQPKWGVPRSEQSRGTCDFKVKINPGVNLVANIQLPEELNDLAELLWMDREAGLQFIGTVPFDLGVGDSPLRLEMHLPKLDPPDADSLEDGAVDFLEGGSLRLVAGVNPATQKAELSMQGQLDTRWRRSEANPGSCDVGTLMDGVDIVDGDEVLNKYCYDRLRFGINTALTLGAGDLEISLEGLLLGRDDEGWEQPFGIEWLTVRALVLRLSVKFAADSSVEPTIGFRGDVGIGEKNVAVSLSVGMRIVPAPPPTTRAIVPTFQGFRGFFNSAGMEDIARLQALFAGGGQPIPLDQLPDLEVRNAEIMFALDDIPSLCLKKGFGIAGELYVDPTTSVGDTPLPPGDDLGCRELGAQVDPEHCASVPGREEGCFASFLATLDLNGMVIDGSVGALNLGPVYLNAARLVVKLTAAEQAFVVSGGATIQGLGSGELAISVKPPNVSFYGDIKVFGVFNATVDGSLQVALKPPFLLGTSADFHAALDVDFERFLKRKVDARLRAIRSQVSGIKQVWDSFTGANGVAGVDGVVQQLATFGTTPPAWLTELVEQIEFVESLLPDGEALPDLSIFFTGGTLTYDVGRAVSGCPFLTVLIDGVCVGLLGPVGPPSLQCPLFTTLEGTRCIARIEVVPLSAIGDVLGLDFPETLDEAVSAVKALFEAGVGAITGLASDLDTYFQKIVSELSGISLVTVRCAEFGFVAGADTGTAVDLKLKMDLLGKGYGFEQRWDFSDVAVGLPGLVQDLLSQFFSGAEQVQCTGPAAAPAEIDTATPPITLQIQVAPGAVTEGAPVTLTGTFSSAPSEPVDVTLDWGDGSRDGLSVSTGTFTAQHVYADDDPSGTSSDTYTVRASVSGLAGATANVVVRNAGPTVPQSTLDAISATRFVEGTRSVLSIGFDDPGVDDVHTVTIDWGDGQRDVVEDLPVGDRTATVGHLYVDDDPTGTPSDSYPVTLTVSDDDGGTTSRTVDVAVENDAPSRLVVTLADATIPEIGIVRISGAWADRGIRDRHTVEIDWGHPDVPSTSVTPSVRQRTFSAAARYGDDGIFTITVRVRDDDTGEVVGTTSVVVNNLDPRAELDRTGTVSVNGVPTVLTRIDDTIDLAAAASDPGSDDLLFRWDFDRSSASTDAEYLSLVPGQAGEDPDPSPNVAPRYAGDSAGDAQSHAYSSPCLYQIGLTVDDDDGGRTSDDLTVIVQGRETVRRTPGYWSQQYDDRQKTNTLSDDLRGCYLRMVSYMSPVFGSGDPVPLATSAEAYGILDGRGKLTPLQTLQRHLLATWLNFAHGSYDYAAEVDTDGDGQPDASFEAAVIAAESTALDPSASRDALLAQAVILDRLNKQSVLP